MSSFEEIKIYKNPDESQIRDILRDGKLKFIADGFEEVFIAPEYLEYNEICKMSGNSIGDLSGMIYGIAEYIGDNLIIDVEEMKERDKDNRMLDWIMMNRFDWLSEYTFDIQRVKVLIKSDLEWRIQDI